MISPFKKCHVCHNESVSRGVGFLINGLLPDCLDDVCKGWGERDSRLQSGTYQTYSQTRHIFT